jgi:hypothetical protein
VSEPGLTDDEAAAIDVPALLRSGIAEAPGRLRGELQGEGALAAAIQLGRDGVVPDDVVLALTRVRNEAMGIEMAPVDLPPRLTAMLEAGAAEDPELLAAWLGLVANLMMMRASYGGAA